MITRCLSQQASDPCHDSCTQTSFTFASHARRQVVARFDGGAITSGGGAGLWRQLEQRTAIVRQFAACFRDHRQAAQVEHSVPELVAQRVYGLTLGYEISTITIICAATRCWPCSAAKKTSQAPSGGGHRIAASPARARARSTAWS